MPGIHLMTGFIGFGKTTIAKMLEKSLPAVRFTHDEIMRERYGRAPSDFQEKYKLVDDYIKARAEECVNSGKNVILDYGFWTHESREQYYKWAKNLTDDVVFHLVKCDINEAKRRVLARTKNDDDALMIDENIFDEMLKKYEPWSAQDDYPLIWHNAENKDYIGQLVLVEIDRPIGSKHPKYGFEYPVNYGYVPFTRSGDGEELDAYVLMINEPLKKYVGRCIGVIHRTNDNDDKLVVVPEAFNLVDEDIEQEVAFQERWFKHVLIRE